MLAPNGSLHKALLLCVFIAVATVQAQKKWDGGAGTAAWADALNWSPDGIPTPSDDVLLDHEFIKTPYQVDLPPGAVPVTARTITMFPSMGRISLILPTANTASPGLQLSGSGTSMTIHEGAVFINASGAGSGSTLQLAGTLRINNGGRYIHRTSRGNAEIIDKLSLEAGTEKGIFEFDVPGTTGYTVSLTGNTFGSLYFSAQAAGGNKSYSGSGASPLIVRGDMQVQTGVLLTSTLTSDITIGGNIEVGGRWNLNPVTAGTTGRSLLLTGNAAHWIVGGTISFNDLFRRIHIAKTASLHLGSDLTVPSSSHVLHCEGVLDCGTFQVRGAGSFLLADGAALVMGDPVGISAGADQGNIRTSGRSFSEQGRYVYRGLSQQVTGDGLPGTVRELRVNNPSGLQLTKALVVTDSLLLQAGVLKTGTSNTIHILSGATIACKDLEGQQVLRTTSYIDGPMSLAFASGSSRYIPLGKGNDVFPLYLSAHHSAESNILVEYISGQHPVSERSPLLNQLGARGYWKTSATAGSSWVVGASFLAPEATAITGQTLVLTALRPQNGIDTWTPVTATTQMVGEKGWLTAEGPLNDIQAIGLGYSANNVLPLRLVDFYTLKLGKTVLLRWTANEEESGIRYLVGKSADGRLFSAADSIVSQSRGLRSYEWRDDEPLARDRYYRLAMTGGSDTIYSPVRRERPDRNRVLLYPNPARDRVTINFPGRSSSYTLEIVNSTGAVSKQLTVYSNTCQIRVNDLPPGAYFARIYDRETLFILSFTKH